MTNPDEKRWREALEKLDPETVRAKLAYGHTGRAINAEVGGIVDSPPHPSRGFVEAWLREKDKATGGLSAQRHEQQMTEARRATFWARAATWIALVSVVVPIVLWVLDRLSKSG